MRECGEWENESMSIISESVGWGNRWVNKNEELMNLMKDIKKFFNDLTYGRIERLQFWLVEISVNFASVIYYNVSHESDWVLPCKLSFVYTT